MKEIKILAKDLRLTLATFRNLLAVICLPENNSNQNLLTNPFRQRGG